VSPAQREPRAGCPIITCADIDILSALKDGDSWGAGILQGSRSWSTTSRCRLCSVPCSGPCHVAHLAKPEEWPGSHRSTMLQMVVRAFNILRAQLLCTTPYVECQRTTVCNDGRHLLCIHHNCRAFNVPLTTTFCTFRKL